VGPNSTINGSRCVLSCFEGFAAGRMMNMSRTGP
jgi:hypothetical protein